MVNEMDWVEAQLEEFDVPFYTEEKGSIHKLQENLLCEYMEGRLLVGGLVNILLDSHSITGIDAKKHSDILEEHLLVLGRLIRTEYSIDRELGMPEVSKLWHSRNVSELMTLLWFCAVYKEETVQESWFEAVKTGARRVKFYYCAPYDPQKLSPDDIVDSTKGGEDG